MIPVKVVTFFRQHGRWSALFDLYWHHWGLGAGLHVYAWSCSAYLQIGPCMAQVEYDRKAQT